MITSKTIAGKTQRKFIKPSCQLNMPSVNTQKSFSDSDICRKNKIQFRLYHNMNCMVSLLKFQEEERKIYLDTPSSKRSDENQNPRIALFIVNYKHNMDKLKEINARYLHSQQCVLSIPYMTKPWHCLSKRLDKSCKRLLP